MKPETERLEKNSLKQIDILLTLMFNRGYTIPLTVQSSDILCGLQCLQVVVFEILPEINIISDKFVGWEGGVEELQKLGRGPWK